MTKNILKTAKISSELFILIFGIWTVSSNLAGIFKIPFQSLAILFPVLLIISLIVLIRSRFFREWMHYNYDQGLATSIEEGENRYVEIAFIGLVVIMLFFALFANTHNFDDAHYIRTSVDMADHPEKPVLLEDPLGLFEGAPLLIPVYKAHSIETFCAAISSLTGVPVIYVFHFLLPVIGLFLSVMAHLLIFRVLIPKKALLATIISFVLIYAVSLRAMGNITFIRMHQGKGVLLGVFLPLIIAYGLKAARENKGRDWFLLALSQVCAIGMNATALWLAPVVANLAVIAGSIAFKSSFFIRNNIYALLSSMYIVLFGLYLVVNFQMPPFYITKDTESVKLITGSIHRVFGNGLAMYMSFFVIMFSWMFAPSRQSRIFCIVFPAALLIVFYNPLVARFLAEYIVSEQTYWRTAWLIPLQVFIGIIGVSPFVRNKPSWLIYPKLIFIAGMFLVYFCYSPTKSRLFAKNSRIEIKYPSLKVTKEYYVAEKINKMLDEDDVLVSPNKISMWISTMHRHPETLVYRIKFTLGVLYYYLDVLNEGGQEEMNEFIRWTQWYKPPIYNYPSKSKLAQGIRELMRKSGVEALQVLLDYEFKLTLKEYISGDNQPPDAKAYLAEGLNYYQVTAVCLPYESKWKNDIISVLEGEGFTLIDKFDDFELWKRPSIVNS